jgi:hypothetical protein
LLKQRDVIVVMGVRSDARASPAMRQVKARAPVNHDAARSGPLDLDVHRAVLAAPTEKSFVPTTKPGQELTLKQHQLTAK